MELVGRDLAGLLGQVDGAARVGEDLGGQAEFLETTTWPITRIAEACGFSSAVTFRQNFATAFATTPTSYRRRFAPSADPAISKRTTTPFEVGVLLPSATLSSGTSTLVSG